MCVILSLRNFIIGEWLLSCPLINGRCRERQWKIEDRMEKTEDIRPTAELSPEMIKTICDAISQEFHSWELKEENDDKIRGYNNERHPSLLMILLGIEK